MLFTGYHEHTDLIGGPNCSCRTRSATLTDAAKQRILEELDRVLAKNTLKEKGIAMDRDPGDEHDGE